MHVAVLSALVHFIASINLGTAEDCMCTIPFDNITLLIRYGILDIYFYVACKEKAISHHWEIWSSMLRGITWHVSEMRSYLAHLYGRVFEPYVSKSKSKTYSYVHMCPCVFMCCSTTTTCPVTRVVELQEFTNVWVKCETCGAWQCRWCCAFCTTSLYCVWL